MTLWDLLSLLWRRWYITLAGAALTTVAVILVLSTAPLYYGQLRVVILPPTSALVNGYAETDESLVNLAGVVARSIQGSGGEAQPVSEGITLVGQGVRDGFSVRQPNAGGQWQYRFDEPVLEVQAVGSSPDAVRAHVQQGVDAVKSTLDALQTAQGVGDESRVRTQLNPDETQIFEQRGNRVRALAATAIAGLAATLGVLAMLGPPRKRGSLRRGAA